MGEGGIERGGRGCGEKVTSPKIRKKNPIMANSLTQRLYTLKVCNNRLISRAAKMFCFVVKINNESWKVFNRGHLEVTINEIWINDSG